MNILYLICLLIGFSGLFIYFYLKNIEIEKDIEELYDLYYEIYGTENDKKGKITVLNRKGV